MVAGTIVWVLLMWSGRYHGGPMIIDNFTSKEKCEAAYAYIVKYDREIDIAKRYECLKIEK